MKKKNIIIVIFAILFIGIFYFFKNTDQSKKCKEYDEMIAAAEKMKKLTKSIYDKKISLGIEIPPEDINKTGLIGEEWSEITTTLGDIDAKRTSTDPDFAALILKEMKQLGIKAGDVVAVNMSGSFPALDLATICALDTIGVNGMIISSVGASTYGANLPDFTYQDMEHYLYSKGLIKNKSMAYSLGGTNDIGQEFDAQVTADIIKRYKGYGLEFLYEKDNEKNLQQRIKYYEDKKPKDKKISAFINIGGNLLSLGGNDVIAGHPDLTLNKKIHIKGGLIGYYMDKGIPIIYLLDIKSLANRYGLPVDPSGILEIGKTAIYFDDISKVGDMTILILFVILMIILVHIKNKRIMVK